jgi:hypothetical protein
MIEDAVSAHFEHDPIAIGALEQIGAAKGIY